MEKIKDKYQIADSHQFILLKAVFRLDKRQIKSFASKPAGLRTCNATTVNPLRKVSLRIFLNLGCAKTGFP